MKVVALKTNNSTVTLALLLQAIPELYPRDKSTPGVVLAFLPHREGPDGSKGLFYGSVVRYEGDNGTGKQVLFSATEPTLTALLETIAESLLERTASVKKLARNIRRSVKG